jgi:hypothetical protein
MSDNAIGGGVTDAASSGGPPPDQPPNTGLKSKTPNNGFKDLRVCPDAWSSRLFMLGMYPLRLTFNQLITQGLTGSGC